ncbi:MAG TPA: ATP-binding protein [Candidatus Methylacidiphilales bacterium]|nr:ATP-binding protein [Candidatus Methylacidiphilales bacterium]
MPSTEDLRQSFFEYNRDVRISNSKAGCMLVVVLMPAGVSLDYFVYPNKLGLFLLLRIICSLLAFLLWVLLSTPLGRRHFRVLGMLWFVLPSLFISMMIYFEQGVTSSYYAGLNLVLVAISWVAQVDVLETCIAVALTLLMYCVACFSDGPVSVSVLFNNLYFIVLTGIIAVTGSYYVNRLRFREFALRAEVDQNRKQLEASNLKLVELDKAKSEFFANISHELRTPLTLLVGPLERMRADFAKISAGQRTELLDIMYGNAMRLLRLINDLLNLVQLDSGTLVLRKEKMGLRALIEGLAQSVSPMAQQCHLEFTTRIAIAEDKTAWVDRDKAEKIVYNLLFNAFKFTPPKGRVSLVAEVIGEMLEITVSDTGVGIASSDLAKIFDRFWQVERSSARRYQGAGIGLALVKELAKIHGGEASAESELGRGTTMRIKLDVSTSAAGEAKEKPQQTPTNEENAAWLSRLYRRAELFPAHVMGSSNSSASDTSANGDMPHVLIVDDEPDMRRFLHSQLHDLYHVHEARNGTEALTAAKTETFSLILLDFMMPDMDGIEVMRRLKEIPGTGCTPIIILTARADEDFKIKTLRAGATDFLTKPFSSAELMVRANNIISVQNLQQQLVKKTDQLEHALEQIKETESQMVHQAKMASLGQLSAGLMHEINNPLNFANTAFHLLKKRLSATPPADLSSLSKPLADIQDGIKRVVEITTSLRTFTHPDTESFTIVDLGEAVASAVRFVQFDRQQMALHVSVPQPMMIRGNSNQLVHLFINMLQNSIDSLQEKNGAAKEIRIEASAKDDEIEVIFFDNGIGIAQEDLPRIYDAFFTTKKVGSGVGLGLNISHRIIEHHQGRIMVESKKNEYCRFRLIFPQAKP